jgi:hypothetical protein
MCSWSLILNVGRRPLIVYGTISMTVALLIIGGICTINIASVLKARQGLNCLYLLNTLIFTELLSYPLPRPPVSFSRL